MPGRIRVIAKFTLLEALRNRLLWLLVTILLAAFMLAEFIGALAITESLETRTALLAALLRLSAVFVVSLFVISSGVRELNDKGTELVLSLPVPRASYYAGKMLGFSIFALLTAALFSCLLVLYAPASQAFLWGGSMGFELLIVTAFSLFCLFTLRQVTVALSAVMAFYLLSRTTGAIQLISQGSLVDPDSLSHQIMTWMIDAIAFVLPGLDRFTASEWLIYDIGGWQDLAQIAGQTLVYLLLLSGASLFDLYRRNF